MGPVRVVETGPMPSIVGGVDRGTEQVRGLAGAMVRPAQTVTRVETGQQASSILNGFLLVFRFLSSGHESYTQFLHSFVITT